MKKIRSLGIFLIKWRYVIALFVLFCSISLNLNGSSIANWNSFGVRETVSGIRSETKTVDDYQGIQKLKLWIPSLSRNDDTIIGSPRPIRSDEWLVQTPFYLSQVKTGNHFINKSYQDSGQNMMLAYNVSSWHISTIGKPFNWGFLFLGASRGLSWYWSFKIIALLLLSYEFAMILTSKRKILSVVSSFWITFTPTVQWWFMQHLGDVVFFSLLIMVSIYHYFNSEKKVFKIIMAINLIIALIGFPLIIYPAFQVPFAYVIMAFTAIQLFKALKNKKVKLFDVIVVAVTLFVSLMIDALTIYQSWDAISATLHTVYPGKRISLGGEYTWKNLSDFLFNIFLPFKTPQVSNQVELSSSFNFLLYILLILPFVIKREDIKKNIFGIILVIYSLMLMFYSIVGIPTILAKLTLFSYVPFSRSWQSMSVIAVFASVWFISFIWDRLERIKLTKILPSLLFVTILYLYRGLTDDIYKNYLGRFTTISFIVIMLVAFICILYRKNRIFYSILLVIIATGGLTVNPVTHGIGVIENKLLSHEVESIVEKNPNAIWMSDSTNLYHFVQMFGAKGIDGVRFYPDKQLMTKIDKQNQYEEVWNRYAHLKYSLTNEKTSMTAPVPDNVNINLNIKELKDLNVKYILTTRDLNKEFGSSFTEIYHDNDNNKIFEYLK